MLPAVRRRRSPSAAPRGLPLLRPFPPFASWPHGLANRRRGTHDLPACLAVGSIRARRPMSSFGVSPSSTLTPSTIGTWRGRSLSWTRTRRLMQTTASGGSSGSSISPRWRPTSTALATQAPLSRTQRLWQAVKRRRRPLLYALGSLLALGAFGALTLELDKHYHILDPIQRRVLSYFASRLIEQAKSDENVLARRNAVRTLAFLAETPWTAKQLVEQDILTALQAAAYSSDAVLRTLVARTLADIMVAGVGKEDFLAMEGPRILAHLVQEGGNDMKDEDTWVLGHVGFVLRELILNKDGDINENAVAVVEQMGWKPLLTIGSSVVAGPTYHRAISSAALKMSMDGESAQKIVHKGGLPLLELFAKVGDDTVKQRVARIIANIATQDALSSFIGRGGAHSILYSVKEASVHNPEIKKQVVRALANLSNIDHNRQTIMREGWLSYLTKCLHPTLNVDEDTKLSALVALGNLAFDVNFSQEILLRVGVDRLKGMAHSWTLNQLPQQSQDVAPKQLPTASKSENKSVEECQQLLRLLANLTKNEELVEQLFQHFDVNTLTTLASFCGKDKQNERRAVEHAARALGNMSMSPSVARKMVLAGGSLDEIRRLAGESMLAETQRSEEAEKKRRSDYRAQQTTMIGDDKKSSVQRSTKSERDLFSRHMSRVLANLAVAAGDLLKSVEGLDDLLNSFINSRDPITRANAIRAKASLVKLELTEAKYTEGVHLLYPSLEMVRANSKGGSFFLPQPKYDIVFVHGVTGHPYATWTAGDTFVGEEAKEEYGAGYETFGGAEIGTEGKSAIWPKDWIPEDLPGVRVISVEFELFLSKWFGSALPLQDQSKVLLEKLKLAAIGNRPVVFVSHSFGGLLVKQMLQFASEEERYRNIIDNTAGIVFYGTPHNGVEYTKYAHYTVNALFRGTSAIDDLQPKNFQLVALNENFPSFAKHISTLSFGESITCFGSQYNCYQVVTDESANPRFKEIAKEKGLELPQGVTHSFIKINADHIQICKPYNKKDVRYAALLRFLKHALRVDDPFSSSSPSSSPSSAALDS